MKLAIVRRLRQQCEGGGQDYAVMDDAAYLIEDMYDALTQGAQLNLPDFLEWIAARLVTVHGEDRNVDYVHTLHDRAKKCRAAIAKAEGKS